MQSVHELGDGNRWPAVQLVDARGCDWVDKWQTRTNGEGMIKAVDGSLSYQELCQCVADEIARRHGVAGMAKTLVSFTIVDGRIENAYASIELETPASAPKL